MAADSCRKCISGGVAGPSAVTRSARFFVPSCTSSKARQALVRQSRGHAAEAEGRHRGDIFERSAKVEGATVVQVTNKMHTIGHRLK